MKYIRTEDEIYSYEPTHDVDVDGFIVQHNLTGWNKPLMKEDIIKIADTIEELCDCFIKIKRKNNCKDYILKFDYKDLEELKKQFIKFPQSPVYAGIQIDDKGIIYKAKMKGILPDGEIEWDLL